MSKWAQPKRPSPDPSSLRRGHWYRVESRTDDGRVTVIGHDGVRIPLNQSSLRIIEHEPNTITRLPKGTDFDSPADIQGYGICPKGHNVGRIYGDHAQCSECDRTYAVEDEEVYTGG